MENVDLDNQRDLILLRGLPGAGKTTLANSILLVKYTTESDVLSADDFFMGENGHYEFDSSKLKDAHNYCQFRCSEKMRQGAQRIVIANTFTQEWEMEPYFKMANVYGYRVHTVIVENRHGGENVHNVPEDKLQQMKDRFQIKL